MSFLLDENVPAKFQELLKNNGYKVEHINSKHKGMIDKEVLAYAYKNKQIIISQDFDFCQLRQREHWGIIKISGKIENPLDILLKLLKHLNGQPLKDVYVQVDKNKIFKEIKVYSKKKHKFKHYQKIPIILD